ncbi:unnamed protein product, partial [Nesidiocoris tenuis]
WRRRQIERRRQKRRQHERRRHRRRLFGRHLERRQLVCPGRGPSDVEQRTLGSAEAPASGSAGQAGRRTRRPGRPAGRTGKQRTTDGQRMAQQHKVGRAPEFLVPAWPLVPGRVHLAPPQESDPPGSRRIEQLRPRQHDNLRREPVRGRRQPAAPAFGPQRRGLAERQPGRQPVAPAIEPGAFVRPGPLGGGRQLGIRSRSDFPLGRLRPAQGDPVVDQLVPSRRSARG